MDPMEFLRLVRRRWLLLFLCAAAGAALGYASTLLQEEDPGPVVTHWAAGEVLVVDPDNTIGVDLQRVAVFATAGEVTAKVAEARGMEVPDLSAALRTVSDSSEGTITISAVATSAADARDLAEEVTTTLLDELAAEGNDAYEEQVAQIDASVQSRLAAVTALDDRIAKLRKQAANNAGGEDSTGATDGTDGLSPEQADELRSLLVQRDAALLQYSEAQKELEDLQRLGAPAAPLSVLDKITPFRISAREYEDRLGQGRQGENNFSDGEVELADTSSPTVSERLENPATRAALGGLAALLLGLMFIGVHHRLDPRLRSRDAIEEAFGLPVLATVPSFGRKERRDGVLHSRDFPRSAVSEAYRYLRSVLLFARSGMSATDTYVPAGPTTESNQRRAARDVRVVMVTSAGEGEGKTTTAVNLAVLLAESGYQTMLVNCDFRLPSAHKAFDLPYEPGTVAKTSIPNLRFISDVRRTEGDTPGQVSERQRKLIRKVRGLVDVVILDTAPLLATNDAIDVLPETDLAVLVAREGKTTGDAAGAAAELLTERIGVPVAGVVVTAVGAGLGGGYYEKYRHGSYFRAEDPNMWHVARRVFGRKKAPHTFPLPLADDEPPAPAAPVVIDTYQPTHADEIVAAPPAPVAAPPAPQHHVNGHAVHEAVHEPPAHAAPSATLPPKHRVNPAATANGTAHANGSSGPFRHAAPSPGPGAGRTQREVDLRFEDWLTTRRESDDANVLD